MASPTTTIIQNEKLSTMVYRRLNYPEEYNFGEMVGEEDPVLYRQSLDQEKQNVLPSSRGKDAHAFFTILDISLNRCYTRIASILGILLSATITSSS
jgi:hypothetical protein